MSGPVSAAPTRDRTDGVPSATAVADRPTVPPAPPARPPAAPPAPSAAPAGGSGWMIPVMLLVIGNFMAVLDVTIVNVAVPAIQKDFGGSLDDVLWIATAYTLMLGIVVPVSSWLGERFGLTNVYIMSLAGFAAGSALCGSPATSAR
jgi:hypothetical protein